MANGGCSATRAYVNLIVIRSTPAISIDQKSASRNPRSTVGTVTEIYDYLRLLFAQAFAGSIPKVLNDRAYAAGAVEASRAKNAPSSPASVSFAPLRISIKQIVQWHGPCEIAARS